MLAVSLLAATGGSADEVAVGRTDTTGGVSADQLTGVKLTNAAVSSFELDGKKLEVSLGSDGQIDKVLVDGAAPRLSKLPRVRLSPKPGDAWLVGSQRWDKLGGAPRGLAVDDGRFVLGAAEQSDGFDAVVTGETEKDPTIHARVLVKGRGGGLLVRGQPGEKSYDGIAVLLSIDPKPKATLILVDGKAKATELGPGVELGVAGPGGYLVVLSAKGQSVSATVDGKKLEAKLERGVGSGRSGLMVVGAGQIEVSGFGRGAPKAEKKKAEPEKKKPAVEKPPTPKKKP
ncbi:MAG: hypothetical protein DYH12_26110 [Sorangiineae bacterium PRO1]|nr:hypothetical protein [Sorangiineae bacterium PRO1]